MVLTLVLPPVWLLLFSARQSAAVRDGVNKREDSPLVAETEKQELNLPECFEVANKTYPGGCDPTKSAFACYSMQKVYQPEQANVDVKVQWVCSKEFDQTGISQDACSLRPWTFDGTVNHTHLNFTAPAGIYAGACEFSVLPTTPYEEPSAVATTSVQSAKDATTPERLPMAATTSKKRPSEQSTKSATTPGQSQDDATTPEKTPSEQSAKSATTPGQSQETATTPEKKPSEQSAKSATTPGQSQETATTPEKKPLLVATTPKQSAESATTPEQTTEATTTPEKPLIAATAPEESTKAATTPEQPTKAATTPKKPSMASTTPEQSTKAATTPEQPPTSQSTTKNGAASNSAGFLFTFLSFALYYLH